MKEEDRENAFLRKILSELDESTRNLDPGTLSRLRHIRMQVREADRAPAGWRSLFRLPAAAIATAAVFLLAFIVYLAVPVGVSHHSAVEDVEILATSDNLEFYEDLDFYKWLSEKARTSGKDTLLRHPPLLTRYAWKDSTGEAMTGSGREEEYLADKRQTMWAA